MERWMLSKLLWPIAGAAFIASACEHGARGAQVQSAAISRADEREIIATVLKHLSARPDSPLGPPDGMILVKAKTDAWTKESLAFYSSSPKPDCSITQDHYARFVERNS